MMMTKMVMMTMMMMIVMIMMMLLVRGSVGGPVKLQQLHLRLMKMMMIMLIIILLGTLEDQLSCKSAELWR